MPVQERLRGITLMELNERERVQDMCRQHLPTLGELAKKAQRPVGPLVEHRGNGGQQEKVNVRGTGRQSLFGKGQNTRPSLRERREQAILPDLGRVVEKVCLPQSLTDHGPPNQTLEALEPPHEAALAPNPCKENRALRPVFSPWPGAPAISASCSVDFLCIAGHRLTLAGCRDRAVHQSSLLSTNHRQKIFQNT